MYSHFTDEEVEAHSGKIKGQWPPSDVTWPGFELEMCGSRGHCHTALTISGVP